jgi:hypothetical protein
MSSTSTFSFAKGLYYFDWDEDVKLNDRKYRSPVPCRKGYNCVHTECCMFVHPGEEGVGRRLFPARSMEEEDVVRIYGTPEKKAYFYERRRLGLSWPAWCKQMGWTLPIAPYQSKNSSVVPMTPNHNRKQIINIVEQTCITQETPTRPSTPTLKEVFTYEEDKEENPFTQSLGDKLYELIDNLLDELAIEEMKKANIYSSSVTPGKIVGMLLESCPINYCHSLLQNENEFHQAVLDACVTIVSH